ncbi:MAG: tRNA-dihydrouridine synthase, partial [Phycisphaerae bacterium]|nr:tRNA-dihydrouridine synthase [Phycisphaerae bacterium]
MLQVQPLKIGNVQLATNLLLAPIAGYCDLAFRLVVRSCGGVGMACTDLLSSEGLLRETPHSLSLARTAPGDSPLCMQIYGSVSDRMCEAARWAEDHGADVVDINMGC